MSNTKSLKICHIITRMIVGGAQENTLLSILRHRENGHRPTLITGPSPGPEGELLRQMNLPDLDIIELPDLVREISPIRDLKASRAIYKICRERKFDVVHTHASKAGIVGRVGAWEAKVPFVAHTVHGQAFHPYQSMLKNQLFVAMERYAAKRCHHIYAVAQAMIDQCVTAGIAPREKYSVVYSGMRLDNFLNAQPDEELRRKLGIPEHVPVIATLARLFRQKGYEYVIPAAARMIQNGSAVHFLIIGNGNMREAIDAQLQELKIAEHFHFVGLIPPDEVGKYLALSDQLWHLSLHEGLPRSAVQSLACGNPVIGFRLDGTPEVVIDDETGYCVAAEDVEAVARRASELLQDPERAKQMGARGRELVKARFDWRKMGDTLEASYQTFLNK